MSRKIVRHADQAYTLLATRHEAEGRHRREYDWEDVGYPSEPDEHYQRLDTPDGSYSVFTNVGEGPEDAFVEHLQPDQSPYDTGTIFGRPEYNVLPPEGYPGGFSHPDEAKDWVERQNVPQGGGRHYRSGDE